MGNAMMFWWPSALLAASCLLATGITDAQTSGGINPLALIAQYENSDNPIAQIHRVQLAA
jgi:hypothetical protein